MPHVIVSFKGAEVGRWPLEGPLTIGRSTECDVVVRDILLSRRHCSVQPYRNGWVAVDLGSKNGTFAEGDVPIARRGLIDGDVLHLGKTTVRYRAADLPAGHKPPRKRPADPFEAMSGTTMAFDPAAVVAYGRSNGLPAPRPIPREPDAYERDDLYGLLSGIASSSWDSIYAQASQPRRPIARLDPSPRTVQARPATPLATAGRHVAGPVVAVHRPRLALADELQVGDARATRAIARQGSVAAAAQPSVQVETPRPFLARVARLAGRPFVALRRWVG